MPKVSSDIEFQWQVFSRLWRACSNCSLGARANLRCLVRGTLPCDVVFLGMGPGKTEDAMGLPFMGLAGRVVDGWIHDLLIPRGLSSALMNLVACRPCDTIGGPNRDPEIEEVQACSKWLERAMDFARPKHLVGLGRQVATRLGPEGQNPALLHLVHPAFISRRGGIGCEKDDEARKTLASWLDR